MPLAKQHTEILKDIRAKSFRPVYLLHGEEPYFTDVLAKAFEDKAIDDLFPTAFAVLSEMELTLSRSAVVLTVPQSSLALRRRVRKRRQPHGAE